MTLTELQQLLDAARAPRDVFGDDLVMGFRRLAGICHPDRYTHGTPEAALASELFKRLGQWKTMATTSRPSVVSPQGTYQLGRRIGRGDLCDVYEGSGDDETFVLKIPRIATGNNLMAKEREVLEQLIEQSRDDLYDHYFPRPVETFRTEDRRINVFQWRDGFYDAERIHKRHDAGLDGRHLAWMFNRLLEVLGYLHRKGWVHGAVVPAHLMFHAENHGLQLVGWIHAVQLNQPLTLVPEKRKSWYPPECHRREPVGPATDIYLAAKSLVYLSGGQLLDTSSSEGIPFPIRQFIRACLLESPRMRPQDAWALREEFSELLEGVYGSPRYHRLEMP